MILYTRNQCSACEGVKSLLNSKSIDYDLVNIQRDPESAMKLVDAGVRSVPVLELDSGELLIGSAEIQAHL